MNKIIFPSQIAGRVSIPGSKSHTIRALLIASLAKGKSKIFKPLYSSDTLSCIEACKILGAKIEVQEELLIIQGNGGKFPPREVTIDVGNSGTTLYLATAVAALSTVKVNFTGDEQIQRRSAAPLLDALADLGVKIQSKNGCAPFSVRGPILGGETTIQCPTSQYLSALLVATPLAQGKTILTIPLLNEKPYVEITLDWLKQNSIKIESQDFSHWEITGRQHFTPFEKNIPADFSSASFFICAAAITNCQLKIDGVDMNDAQGDKEIVYLLQKMGANIEILSNAVVVHPRKNKFLQGINIDLNALPDALPILAVTAAFAQGITRLQNVTHARLKETDRVAVMAQELTKLGVKVEEHPDGLTIYGGTFSNTSPQATQKTKTEVLPPYEVKGHNDHRIVMAFAVAALGADRPISISTAEAAAVTFPEFFEKLRTISKEEQ